MSRPSSIAAGFAFLALTGCTPTYQPYYVVVPYVPGADAKASEDAARTVIEQLRRGQSVQLPIPAPSVQSMQSAEPIPFTDQPDQDPRTR